MCDEALNVYFENVLFHCGLMFVSLVVTVLLY